MIYERQEIAVEPTYGIWTVFIGGRPVARYFEREIAEGLAEDYRNNETMVKINCTKVQETTE